MKNKPMELHELYCGPLGIAEFLQVNVDDVLDDWPAKWKKRTSDKGFLGLPIDTHIHHKAYLKSKGYGITMRDQPEVGAIVLLNDSLLDRHWGLIHDITETDVYVNWLTVPKEGDGEFEIIRFSKDAFKKRQEAWPDFMYKIGGDPVKLNWLEKLYIFISGL